MNSSNPELKLVHVVNAPQTLASFLGSQASFMASRGFDVTIISDPADHLTKYCRSEKVRAVGVPIARQIAPLRDLGTIFRLWRFFLKARPDIVHAHTPKAGILAMLAAYFAAVPIRIYHVRGVPSVSPGKTRGLLRTVESLTCRLANRVFCVSPSIRDVVVSSKLCCAKKTKAILHGSGNGIDAAHRFNPARFNTAIVAENRASYGIPADALVLGYVGRVIREKGIVELFDSWVELRTRFPELHLLIVGPIETHDPIPEDTIQILRRDPRVHLVGPDWDTPRFYSMMDILAFPTYREGFGMVALEAGAMGIPVVATKIPGCVDSVKDGMTGTLVPARSAAALLEAIDRYCRNPALRDAHGTAGRKRATQDFRPSSLSQATLNEYQTLLLAKGYEVRLNEVVSSRAAA